MNSVRNKLMLLFVSSIAILLLLVGGASYRWTRGVAEGKVSESTVLMLEQIDRNMETLIGSIHDISLFLIANRNVRGYLAPELREGPPAMSLRESVNDDLANLTTSKSFILSIAVYGDNGLRYESVGPSIVAPSELAEPAIPDSGEMVRSRTYVRRYQALGDRRVISFYRRLRDPSRLTLSLGSMRIDLDEAAVAELGALSDSGPGAYVFMCDSGGYVLAHPAVAEIGHGIAGDPTFARALDPKPGFYRARVGGIDALVTHYPSPRGIFVSVRPSQGLFNDSGASLVFSLVLFSLATLVAAAAAWWIATTITAPVKLLAEGMGQVEAGGFGFEVPVSGNDEIAALGRSFNRMSGRIRTLIDEVYTIELVKKEAELKALQAQVNPHFLYNTLDVIYWSAKMEGATKTARDVHTLSRLFRLGLDKGDGRCRLGDELEHLRCYLEIQLLRYDEPPEIVIEVEPELEGCLCAKLILQPLVENAFLHGIADIDRRGRIELRGFREGEELVLSVADNGVGMDEETMRRALESDQSGRRGFGVWNVDQRIKLFFGPQYGARLESSPGRGTKVTIRMPFRSAAAAGEEA